MAQFTDITITRAGLDMIAKSQAGDNLIFTGLKIGDGQISGQSIPDLTDLISVKKEIPINSVTAKNEGHVEILGIIDNEDISVGFFVREIGIYAKINEGGTPALYGYTNAGNYASYISDKSVPMDAFKFKIDLVVGNAANVSFVSDKSIVYVTQENLDAHNESEDSHPDIRKKITAAITAHNSLETAHPDLDFVTQLDAAADGLHYRTRNGKSDQVIDLINQLQATLSQGTVPSGNTGTLAALLSGIVHQIKALSGKSNWWDTPKNSFETLSAGVVAGDVSNPNSWWVKLGGTIPLIIQGGNAACASRNSKTVTFPVAFSSVIFAGNAPYKLVGGSNYGTGQGVASYTTTSITITNTSETAERYWSAFQWCAIGH